MDGVVARKPDRDGGMHRVLAAGMPLAAMKVAACKPGPSDTATSKRADAAKPSADASKPATEAGVTAVKGIVAGAGLSAAAETVELPLRFL